MALTTAATLTTAGARAPQVVIAAALDRILSDNTQLAPYAVFMEYAAGSGTDRFYRRPAAIEFANATSDTTGGYTADEYAPVDFDLTPARKLASYSFSSLATLTDSEDPGDWDDAVSLLVVGAQKKITSTIAANFSSVTAGEGALTDPLTVDTVYDGIFQLNTSAVEISQMKPVNMVVNGVGFNYFQADLRNEGGANQLAPATQEMLKAMGPGLKGIWNNVRIIQSDKCPTSGGGAYGAMFDDQAFAFTLMPVAKQLKVIPKDRIVLASQYMFVELDRVASNATSDCYGNIWLASAIAAESARATKLAHLNS